MSQYVETPCRAFTAGAARDRFLRVKLSGTSLATAGASDVSVGTQETESFAATDIVPVRLTTAQGTRKMIASEAITAGNPVYAAASGKIAGSGTVVEGRALETSADDGDVIEVLGIPNTDISAVQEVTPDDSESALNTIVAGVTAVDVQAATNDTDDFIVLPSLADVPVGHEITILCNAGTDFELRTPATSAEEINSEDCDGTKEYLCTDTEVVKVVKISDTIGWMAHAYSAIGAVADAVEPD
jgi:hypothetical protein